MVIGSGHGAGLHVVDADGRSQRFIATTSDRGFSWSPDGEWIVFQSLRNGQMDLFRVSTVTRDIQQLNETPAWDSEPVWSADGSQILFPSESEGKTDIYRMNGDGSEITQVASELYDEVCARWSPDGRSVIFLGDELIITSLDDASTREVFNGSRVGTCQEVSSDGQFVAFMGY